MNVLVVNPPSRSEVYGSLAPLAAIEIPVWAGLMARYLSKWHEVELLDCEVENWTAERSAREVQSRAPDLAVFMVYGQQPSASTQCLPAAERVAAMCGVRTIAIGTHPSALPERTLREGPWTYVCTGEGPLTVKGLLDALGGMGGLDEVPGLCWRDGKAINKGKPAPVIENLDATLGDRGFGLFDFNRYRAHNWHTFGHESATPYASLQTSLGCPFRCTFCCINAPFGASGIRFWSAANVLAAFDELADRGVTHVKIPDEMFVLNPRHVTDICNGLIARGHQFNIWAYARIDTVKDDKLLETMRRAGFNWLGIGIESGSTHVRAGVEKGFGERDIVSSVHKVRSHGIHVAANYIFGLPDDDMKSMRATLDLACELNTEWANFYSGMPYPGSALYEESGRRGWRRPDDLGGPGWLGYSQHSYYSMPLPTEHLRSETVLEFRDRAFHTYFGRPEYLSMIEREFGKAAADGIRKMNGYRIQRQYWMEGVHDSYNGHAVFA